MGIHMKSWRSTNNNCMMRTMLGLIMILLASSKTSKTTTAHTIQQLSTTSDTNLENTEVSNSTFVSQDYQATDPDSDVGQLQGEAGYRMASLLWKLPTDEIVPDTFRVRYCERHAWGLHRCRNQTMDNMSNSTLRMNRRTGRNRGIGSAIAVEVDDVSEDEDGEVDEESSENQIMEKNEGNVYKIDIGGLRMATNYSFEILPQDIEKPVDGLPAQITLQTKGFSASARNCLADTSIVVVETGPFFGGRISVENAQNPSCFLKGDPQSPETKYTLRIRHEECGSLVNGSKVTTVILVQENLPILTHSTRRFVVVCSFSPESFIVKAGVNLPRDTGKGKSMDLSPRPVRISPQNSNIIIADKTNVGSRGARNVTEHPRSEEVKFAFMEENNETEIIENFPETDVKKNEFVDSFNVTDESSVNITTSSNAKKHEEHHNQQEEFILQNNRQRQSRAYFNNNKNNNDNDRRPPLSLVENNRKSSSSHSDGSVQGYLVFGMICIVIVSGLASVSWFIKSSYGKTAIVGPDDSDGPSSISSSSSSGRNSSYGTGIFSELSSISSSLYSTTNNDENIAQQRQIQMSSSVPDRVPHNLDTRSELEVELDFEFSEEIHSTPVLSKKRKLTLDLDENHQLSSASHA